MATWKDLGTDSLAAATSLLRDGRFRSCISRAYYAAYSAATSELRKAKGVTFRYGWSNPSHEQLPRLIRDKLTSFGEASRRELLRAIRRLRMAREDADYRPAVSIDRGLTVNVVRDACLFLRILERRP
ncbi:MAG: HEPN domain-containing protein [Phycisphaerae bacterium]